MQDITVLATVNGEPITEHDVEETLKAMGQKRQAYDNERGRAAILEQLIDRKLLLLDAKRNLLERDEEFKAELAKFKDELLSSYAADKAVRDAKVTDDEVKAFYDEHQMEFVSRERINVSHILVDDETLCQKIKEDVERGDITFEEAARRYSSCPSKNSGGALGDATRGQFVPEFEDAIFGADVGSLIGPVKTQFGYHAIKINGRKPQGTLPFDEVKDRIRERLLGEKQQKAYQSKINQLKILYPVDQY
ncbi:MAG: peptidyl-prolyl cis-trans isomerase [Clostridia bacterium]|nr:peptidyl-prolyl cis-trans isomerase [Clostridia bacterium]